MEKRKLTQRQRIVLELYRKGLSQEQISIKIYGHKLSQGAISSMLKLCRHKGYDDEIETLRQKQLDKFTEPLDDMWLKAKKELEDEI